MPGWSQLEIPLAACNPNFWWGKPLQGHAAAVLVLCVLGLELTGSHRDPLLQRNSLHPQTPTQMPAELEDGAELAPAQPKLAETQPEPSPTQPIVQTPNAPAPEPMSAHPHPAATDSNSRPTLGEAAAGGVRDSSTDRAGLRCPGSQCPVPQQQASSQADQGEPPKQLQGPDAVVHSAREHSARSGQPAPDGPKGSTGVAPPVSQLQRKEPAGCRAAGPSGTDQQERQRQQDANVPGRRPASVAKQLCSEPMAQSGRATASGKSMPADGAATALKRVLTATDSESSEVGACSPCGNVSLHSHT